MAGFRRPGPLRIESLFDSGTLACFANPLPGTVEQLPPYESMPVLAHEVAHVLQHKAPPRIIKTPPRTTPGAKPPAVTPVLPARGAGPRPPLDDGPPESPSGSEPVSISGSVGQGGVNNRVDVIRIQRLLNAAGAKPPLAVDGLCGTKTIGAIGQFQSRFMRRPDGRVDPGGRTLRMLNASAGRAKMPATGGAPSASAPTAGVSDEDFYPPKPKFSSLGHQRRKALFGMFKYVHAPVDWDKDHIRVTDDWATKNIEKVHIPQLVGVPTYSGRQHGGGVRFHKLAVPQLKGLWAAWEKAGLIDRVIFWSGSYVPRFMRGTARNSETQLSNHAWGTAFDINHQQNGLGKQPAAIGEHGCVLELVALANEYGFYWGGHWNRKDGMHFEVAEIRG